MGLLPHSLRLLDWPMRPLIEPSNGSVPALRWCSREVPAPLPPSLLALQLPCHARPKPLVG
jgi:hypothetical protein